ncbi:MAG: hypothetical protein LC647_11565, partial [Beggiatoa sp.]|nr:hypothetical protein [Beggiatoa sp.]
AYGGGNTPSRHTASIPAAEKVIPARNGAQRRATARKAILVDTEEHVMKRMKLLATTVLALSLGPVGVVLATLPVMPEVQTQNGIDYVAGGIGKEQAEAMKVAAHDYDLMLTFATDGGKYLADIGLQIEDMNGNALLNTVSEGPLFLANLPVGRYKITASAQGTSHTRIVDMRGKRPTKAVFQWSGYAKD